MRQDEGSPHYTRIPEARAFRRSRGHGSRFGVCLAVSLAAHAALFVLLPSPPAVRAGTLFHSSVRIQMASLPRSAPEDAPRRTGAKRPLPGAESDNAEAPRAAAPPDAPGEAPTPEAARDYGPEGSATANAGDSAPNAPVAAGEVGPAALLLSRVETALLYPEAARRRGTEGVVGLSIELTEAGNLAGLRTVRSSGSALLDKAARDAVRLSLPVPNPAGQPLTFELAVRFSLKTKTASP